MKRASVLSIFLLVSVALLFGVGTEEETAKKTKRFEAMLSYETLNPHDPYGSWKTFLLSYYANPRLGFTYYFQLGAFSRKEGDAGLAVAGAYKDWSDRFYTYTAVSSGTDSAYLPVFRFDNDFNFKLGKKRNIVWTAGITFLKYHNVHRDLILSSQVTAYFEGVVATYRIFRNRSDPGGIKSFSHLLDAAYGREGWQITNATLSFGKQAYLATYLSRPEEVNQNSIYVVVKHRRWIGSGLGLLGDFSYFKLEDGYTKIGFSLGVFKEF
ncbi:MAG: YaiO family outer membrane beta-barrel protein [Candidatus Aminicenantes bacterium]|nr:YaiO family outer membrane beta-barrel protein [Candidatus Aminicenantes bacterium]